MDSTNVLSFESTQRRRLTEDIIARGRPADGAPEDSDDDDDDGSEPEVLEDELWQRSLMMAEIIERGRENEASANGGGLGGGVAQDELLNAAVEDIELQRTLLLSELTSSGIPDLEIYDPDLTTRPIEGISGAGAAAADESERPNSGGETDGNVAPHRRDPDAEAVADLMAQIFSATEDRRRATESARESTMVNNRWVRGARDAFDRLLSDVRSRGTSDQHHVVESVAPDGNGSHISEARQLIATAFPDWRIGQQCDASDRAALMADIVAVGQDVGTLNVGAWRLEALGGASLLSESAPSAQRATRAEGSGRVRAALNRYERLLGGILRPGRAAAESDRLTEQRPAEDLPASSWQRRNTGSHVDLMADIIARGGQSQRTSDNDIAPQAAAGDDQTRNLFLAEIISRGGQAQTLRRRRMEAMTRAVRQMSEAAHASLCNELDSSSVGAELGVEAPVCVVCIESPRSHAFVPCGHRCVCWGCVRRMRRMSPFQCPICRRDSTDVIKIYL